MKKITRRVLGIAVGLTLGWLAQGYSAQLLAPSMASAADAASSLPQRPEQDSSVDAQFAGAEQLFPSSQDLEGFAVFATLALGLFGIAIVIGVPAASFADRSRHDPADELHHDHVPVVHVHKGSH